MLTVFKPDLNLLFLFVEQWFAYHKVPILSWDKTLLEAKGSFLFSVQLTMRKEASSCRFDLFSRGGFYSGCARRTGLLASSISLKTFYVLWSKLSSMFCQMFGECKSCPHIRTPRKQEESKWGEQGKEKPITLYLCERHWILILSLFSCLAVLSNVVYKLLSADTCLFYLQS